MRQRERLRRLVPGVLAVAVGTSLCLSANAAVAVSGGERAAAKYKFQELPIALPPGYDNQHMNTIREVNPSYHKIRSWISAVGAGIAINDVTGHGRADGMCIVDTRTNQVIVTYTPTAPASDRFTPFTLNPAPLPYDGTMAPTGCAPGDFTGDGRIGFLVTYWGRTPILFLPKSDATTPSPSAYVPRELVPSQTLDGRYHGPRWNTDAVYIGDLDGSGHPSVVIGNYWPDSDVLDPKGIKNVLMPNSFSSANNAGGAHVLRWVSATAGTDPQAAYVEDHDAIPFENSTGWTLAISGADLTGDGLAEVYLANDFGHGYLLYNQSTPGRIKFTEVKGQRTPTTPKSFVLGNGSFKGMGVDFADLTGNGRFDFLVSNINVPWGLQESNFVFINQTKSEAEMARQLGAGIAPFTQQAQQYGLAWTGWCWDVKADDFLNSGEKEVVQTTGFVKGEVNRWNWLQEAATMNDELLDNPDMWPNFQPGDDVSGHEALAFYAKNSSGTYVNISSLLGLAVQTPTRAVATGDTTSTGALDFAVARQWGPPAFYANQAPNRGNVLELKLYRPSTTPSGAGSGLKMIGSPAYGATVEITTPRGAQISQLDGGGGHVGFRSFDVRFGLGSYAGPVSARVRWRDVGGASHQQSLSLTPGVHNLMLTDSVKEVPSR
ncbi:FG-GAP-like repeat-containing protein [Microbispora sp. NBC_01189]|uniref:FG-GAP-like repeat-containing protein n=1 Tax=Microbispora sp. NBC_01189 TaxID=2903583 RepID=UPI002E107B5E|nr:FG-GAP-like repeat-containing protein [Microbispora sp. NBC_01189]